MAAGKGYRGGFNPYRDSHGRFSGGGGGHQQMNDMIRQAAGRGTSGGGGPLPVSVIDRLPIPQARHISSEVRAKLDARIKANGSVLGGHTSITSLADDGGPRDSDPLTDIARSLLYSELQKSYPTGGGPSRGIDPATKDALLSMYAEQGHQGKPATKKQLLALYDSVGEAAQRGETDTAIRRRAYTVATALASDDPWTANTLADIEPPDWDEARDFLAHEAAAED